MTIQPIANQAAAPLNSLEVLNYAFSRKSIEQLSDEIVQLCTNVDEIRLEILREGIGRYQELLGRYQELPLGNLGRVNELSCKLSEEEQYEKLQFPVKDFLNAFNKIDKCKLESTFLFACEYGLTGLVELFINSDRYQDISIDRLNKAFKVWSLKDGGKIIQTLISSDRFREITPKSLGSALKRASDFERADVVRAIMESGRGHEISLEDFGKALELVFEKFFTTTIPEPEIKERRHEILRMFSNFPQCNKVGCVLVEKPSHGVGGKYWGVEWFLKPTESK